MARSRARSLTTGFEAVEAERVAVAADVGVGRAEEPEARLVAAVGVREARREVLAAAAGRARRALRTAPRSRSRSSTQRRGCGRGLGIVDDGEEAVVAGGAPSAARTRRRQAPGEALCCRGTVHRRNARRWAAAAGGASQSCTRPTKPASATASTNATGKRRSAQCSPPRKRPEPGRIRLLRVAAGTRI